MNSHKTRVLAEVERGWLDQVAFLTSLVQCRSELFQEAPVQHLVARKLRSLGLAVDLFDADASALVQQPGYSPVEWGYKGRPQAVGVWKSPHGGRSLVLNGHVDVVTPEPVRLWSYDPWGAQIVGDRMYGRGACDMKAGVSAMIFAVESVRKAGIELAGDVIIQSVIEEECSGNGTLACLARGYVGDGALIPEPTGHQVMMGQLGVLWLRTRVTGASGHVLSRTGSSNAIEKAYVVMQALKELEATWNAQPHPAYAAMDRPIHFNIGMIRGGEWPSSVPAECEFVTRLAFYPGIHPEKAKQQVLAHLHEALKRDPWLSEHPPAFDWYGHHDEGMVSNANDPLIQLVREVHTDVLGGAPPPDRMNTAVTDARFWPLYYGKPATCYGPLGGNLHAADEYVVLPSVLDTTKVIATFLLEWCGVA